MSEASAPSLVVFNALDQFLYARRIYLQDKREPQYSRRPSLTQQIDALKETSMFKTLRDRNKNISGLFFFTLPAFQYMFKAAHVLWRVNFDENDIFQLARVLASNTTNNEALTQILKNPVDQQLELRMLQRIDFKVAFDYFEDYVDSAFAKLQRALGQQQGQAVDRPYLHDQTENQSSQQTQFLFQQKNSSYGVQPHSGKPGAQIGPLCEKELRFVTMMVQVSGASEQFDPQTLAAFVACEAHLLAFPGVRERIYALSSRKNELQAVRAVVAYGRESAIFPMTGGALQLDVFERELRSIFGD